MFQALRCYDRIPEQVNLTEEKSILAHSLGALSPWSADSSVLRPVAMWDNASPHHTQEGKRDRHKEITVLHPT